ncbi:four-carbon acid sugar kinase family protein [Streptomyces sp. NPDC050095]|uniref:four-carbon acid sugar kinase family protein n=1 Tax=unclassified Streptomyces TaxID=2593676 RepID=UPI00343FD4D4
MRVAILADDLTSAGDGAAPFGAARVLLAPPPDGGGSGGGVMAVDLATRGAGAQDAASRTEAAARLFGGARLLLKTVDSTLRGHLAAEVLAAWRGSGRRAVVVAPAFPAQGRTTVRGIQYVGDVPVAASEFGRDPVHPVRCSDLRALLPEATAVPRGATPGIASGGMFVCDAVTDADLDRLVASVPRPEDVLWVGSPGLAAALARRVGPLPSSTTPLPTLPVESPLVVVGSANPVSRRQLAALRRHAPHVRVAHTPQDRREAPHHLLPGLAEQVRELVADGTVDALVLTGGETAAVVLSGLGADGFDLLDEPEPGVAQGLLTGVRRIPLVIKAGGFGDDATLLRLSRRLTGAPLNSAPLGGAA